MFFVATLFVVFSVSVSSSQTDKDFAAKLITASNNFAFTVYKNLDSKDNILISPAGLSVCFSMLFLGANTNTSAQLEEVLGYSPQIDKAQISKGYKDILRQINRNKTFSDLRIANKFYVGNEYKVLENYRDVLSQYYGTLIEQVDFSSQSFGNKINEWIKATTGGKMDKIPEEPSIDITSLVSSSAYFNSDWLEGFQIKNRRRFHGMQKTTIVGMMQSSVKYVRSRRSEELHSTVIKLPYEGENVSMIIVLPDNEIPIARVERKLNWESLKSTLNSVRIRSGRLMMPKFEVRKQYDIMNKLAPLAIDWSDLSGIAGDNFTLNRIDHQTYIEIKEKKVAPDSSPKSRFPVSTPRVIEINRPFIFFIHDKPTGLLLFMGRVNNL